MFYVPADGYCLDLFNSKRYSVRLKGEEDLCRVRLDDVLFLNERVLVRVDLVEVMNSKVRVKVSNDYVDGRREFEFRINDLVEL